MTVSPCASTPHRRPIAASLHRRASRRRAATAGLAATWTAIGTMVLGCVDRSVVDVEPAPCEHGATRETACGVDGGGLLEQRCVRGVWRDEDTCWPTRCEAGDERVVGRCTLRCDGGAWDWSDCAGPTMALGYESACVVDRGRVVCWGVDPIETSLGGGNVQPTGPFVVDDTGDAVSVAQRNGATCAGIASGELRCRGVFTSGNGSKVFDESTPVVRTWPVPRFDMAEGLDDSLVVGGSGVVAVEPQGQVVVGSLASNPYASVPELSFYGQLSRSEVMNAVDVRAGMGGLCALTATGRLACGATSAPFTLVEGLRDVVAFDLGGGHACAVDAEHRVHCWGAHWGGQLGPSAQPIDPMEEVLAPREVAGVEAIDVTVGEAHTCVITPERRVTCWGTGVLGQPGSDDATDVLPPTTIHGLEDVVELEASGMTTCARTGDGRTHCFGSNGSGLLGRGRFPSSDLPVRVVGATDRVSLHSLGTAMCAVDAAGDARCWGRLPWGPAYAVGSPIAALGPVRAVASGSSQACALTSLGEVRCWAPDPEQPYGPADPADATSILEGATQLALGTGHGCASTEAGRVRCWGFGAYGQLGDGSMTSSSTPVEVPNLDGVVAIGAATHISCALTSDGPMRCWGTQDGWSSPSPATFPDVVDAVELALGVAHGCVRRSGGGVLCWGSTNYGATGPTPSASPSVPAEVPGIDDAMAIAVSSTHTCVVHADGGVSCWGSNYDGELGDPEAGPTSASPVRVVGLDDAVSVRLGEGFSCALLRSGEVRCWGRGDEGQLGDGMAWSETPVEVVMP